MKLDFSRIHPDAADAQDVKAAEKPKEAADSAAVSRKLTSARM